MENTRSVHNHIAAIDAIDYRAEKFDYPGAPGKIYFTCSFDDGHVADLRLAELLIKYHLKPTFYIPRTCDWASQSLTESQIRNLSGWVEVGGHTMSHPVLTHITPENARSEIFNCKTWLEDVTGKIIHSFCPPTGRFNKHHISLLQEAGFTSMRTVEMLSHSFQKIKTIHDFVILPTTCQVFNHTGMAYLKNNVKRLKFSNYPVLWKSFSPNWESMSRNYINHLHETATRQNAPFYFHLWGHSWEISQCGLWNSLEHFLQAVHETEGVVFITNAELAGMVRNRRAES